MLLLVGFAVKVGLVPFQVWLPRGYAAAPGPARAIMAGVSVNVGFYGLWRTLARARPAAGRGDRHPALLASLTAVLGIAHAAVQGSLQRVIAYSSVENAGLIREWSANGPYLAQVGDKSRNTVGTTGIHAVLDRLARRWPTVRIAIPWPRCRTGSTSRCRRRLTGCQLT